MIDYENLKKLNEPFSSAFQEKINEVIQSGWFILGQQVKNFETEFSKYCQVKNCVGVANGLDALILSLKALNLPAGSEIIVPSNTYIATILAILHCQLTPKLVEPDIRTYNIDPDRVAEAISSKTSAIMVVHLYGKCCDMTRIMQIAEKHHVPVIEDCAQAHGARLKDRMVGSFGELSAFSFYPTKNLGCLGDGGAVTTDSHELARQIRLLRNYGSEQKYYNEVVGYNSRLDELQAALLTVKLSKLDEINEHKRKLSDIYHNHLKDDFIKPHRESGYFDVFHIYNIRHPKRDALKDYLLRHEIKTEVHYPVPPHHQKALGGILSKARFPISEEIHATTLSLPISFFHTPEDIMKVVEVINRF